MANQRQQAVAPACAAALFACISLVRPVLGGAGADVPWVSYHAKDGATNGKKMTSRTYGEIASEAVSGECVELSKTGQYVEWKVAKPANAIVVRLCTPDAPDGDGASYSLSLGVNGKFRQKLGVDSLHTWLYGKEPNPQSKSPAAGPAHVFFDESRALLDGAGLQAGDLVRLYKDDKDAAKWYVIDLVELEGVDPPAKTPDGFLSVIDFGAVPDDGKDDSAALKACVEKAKADGKGVWIPPGTFHQTEPLLADQVKVRGAGPWYTRLTALGLPKPKVFAGNVGVHLKGSGVEVSDLAINGTLTKRSDISQIGLGGSADHFRIENVWVEHTQAGAWLGACSDGLIRRCRIRNTYADGLHVNQNSHDVVIEHNHCRGNGDDGLVVNSNLDHKGVDGPCRKVTVRHNTAEGQWWGDGMAIYGGEGIVAEQNLVVSAFRGAGLLLAAGTSYGSWPADGIRVVDNVFVDCGGSPYNQHTAAFQIYLAGKDLKGLVFQGNTIRRPKYNGVKIMGEKHESRLEATFADNRIDSPGEDGVLVLDTARGGLTLKGNHFSGVPKGKSELVNRASPDQFILEQDGK